MSENNSSTSKKRKNTIQDFFCPIPKTVCVSKSPTENTFDVQPTSSNNVCAELDQTIQTSSLLNPDETNNNAGALDIGNYVGTTVNNSIKQQLLLNPWISPENYIFPYSVHNKQGKEEKRYAGHKYLDSFNWFILFFIQRKDFL